MLQKYKQIHSIFSHQRFGHGSPTNSTLHNNPVMSRKPLKLLIYLFFKNVLVNLRPWKKTR